MQKFVFLALVAFNALVAEARAEYLAKFEAWLATFKSTNGDSVTVKLPIANINVDVNNNGYMAVIVAKTHALLGNIAFTLRPNQLDQMAKQHQLPSIEVVADIIASCTEPSFLVLDLRPVNVGDKYWDNQDGVENEYQCPAMRTENFRFEYSEEATELIADLLRERMKHAMLSATGRRRVAKSAEKPVKAPSVYENAQVDEPGIDEPVVDPAEEVGP